MDFVLLSSGLASLWLCAWAGVLTRLLSSADALLPTTHPPNPHSLRLLPPSVLAAPVLLLLCASVLLFCPSPFHVSYGLRRAAGLKAWPPAQARSFLLRSAGRALAAPLFPVRLPDFFLADQVRES